MARTRPSSASGKLTSRRGFLAAAAGSAAALSVAVPQAFGSQEKAGVEKKSPPGKENHPTPKPVTQGQKQFTWRIHSINQRDYVYLKDIKEFYLFKRYDRTGPHVWLRSEGLSLKVSRDSDDLFINDIKFCMSLPAQDSEGDLVISRMDLAKLIEPVLRPRKIDNPIVFDTVVIDAGHGGDDPGSPGLKGWEKNYTLDVSLRLRQMLADKGLKTKMVRETDLTVKEKEDRTKVANALPNSIFVSIHFNSGHRSASGIETYALSPHGAASTDHNSRATDYYEYSGNDRDAENIALATAVHAMVLYKVKCMDRGIRRARWTVLTGLQRAGILFEGGFLSNPDEADKINTTAYRDQLADAICHGILRYREVLEIQRKKRIGSSRIR